MPSTMCNGNFNFRPSAKDWFCASTISSSTLTASSVVSGSSPVGAAYVILVKKAVVGKYNSYLRPWSTLTLRRVWHVTISALTFELPNECARCVRALAPAYSAPYYSRACARKTHASIIDNIACFATLLMLRSPQHTLQDVVNLHLAEW